MDHRPPLPIVYRPVFRGPHRTGPIGRLIPGDDAEVAREVERIWLAIELLKKRGGGDKTPGDNSEWIYVGAGSGAPDFTNGTNYGSGFELVRFRSVSISGKRELEIEGTPTGFVSGDEIFLLPLSHRPLKTRRLTNALTLSSGVCITQVSSDGSVTAEEV